MIEFDADAYRSFIENELMIVDKDKNEIPFELNPAQDKFIHNITGKDIILKARQLGFSSLILALAAAKFILGKNERIVCISHETKATQRLLDRVRFYIQAFEKKHTLAIKMPYKNRNELYNAERNNSMFIGTAGDKEFGRGDTITFLHLSEFAFYIDPENMLSSVMQAVVERGLTFIETTANGFNYFKEYWERSQKNEMGFKTHFFDPSWEYSKEFLERKKAELGEKYLQEYPSTAEEAFITSGATFFDQASMRFYLERITEPITSNTIYV